MRLNVVLLLLLCSHLLSFEASAGSTNTVLPYDEDEFHRLLENKLYKDAIELIMPSAEAGNPRAQHMIGELHKASSHPNYEEAIRWFLEAVDQNYAPAKVSLAHMYMSGQGTERDLEKAVELLLEAESQGDTSAKTLLDTARKNGWWGLQ